MSAKGQVVVGHVHHLIDGVDVYPVGVLRGLQMLGRSLDPRTPLGEHRGEAIRHSFAYMRRGWRRRSSWNGYLAEPTVEGLLWTHCGHGWTKRRALASLKRHVGEVQW